MRPRRYLREIALLALATAAAACADLDDELREVLADQRVQPLDFGRSPDDELVELGRVLFFDKELSGNRDIACATCHYPAARTSDDLSLSIGTGGTGVAASRQVGTGAFTLRHAPELFNRGADGFDTLMWDGRIEEGEAWPLPSGVSMPDDIDEDDVLAAQVMLQVGHRNSMRGRAGDLDVDGEPNTLAELTDAELPLVWSGLMDRLLAIDAYASMFRAAFPEVPAAELGFQHAALAIAAYEKEAFALDQSPWDLYLEGDDAVLVDPAKRGALLFFGEAGCAECHEGTLLTDLQAHNMCSPQVGTGLDWGRGSYTGVEGERYAFRTPPLRNVAFTAPYFHAGTHDTLHSAVRYHLDPCAEQRLYEGEGLDPRVLDRLVLDEALFAEVEATADPLARRVGLSDEEISDIVQFLEALSDPAVAYQIADWVPDSVPSGRPVD